MIFAISGSSYDSRSITWHQWHHTRQYAANRLVLKRALKPLFAPRMPLHGLMLRRPQIRRTGVRQPVVRATCRYLAFTHGPRITPAARPGQRTFGRQRLPGCPISARLMVRRVGKHTQTCSHPSSAISASITFSAASSAALRPRSMSAATGCSPAAAPATASAAPASSVPAPSSAALHALKHGLLRFRRGLLPARHLFFYRFTFPASRHIFILRGFYKLAPSAMGYAF